MGSLSPYMGSSLRPSSLSSLLTAPPVIGSIGSRARGTRQASPGSRCCLNVRNATSSATTEASGSKFDVEAAAAEAAARRARNPSGAPRQELPHLPNRKPLYLALAVVGVAAWGAFAQFATNKERLSSSAFRSALVQIKDSPAAQAALGDPIMLVPSLVGDPWISGSVNTMQGRVDLSFEVQGPKGKGRAYFTSIRQASNKSFDIIRFLIVTDAGESVSLLPE